MMRTSYFVLNEAFKNIFINFTQTVITVLIMFLSIITTLFFLTIGLNIHHFINELSERVQMVVYLHDDANIDNIYRQLKENKEVSDLEYITKQQALEKFKEHLQTKSNLFDILGKNPLPASCRLILKPANRNLKDMEALAKKIEKIDGINDIEYGKALLKRYEKIIFFIFFVIFSTGFLLFITMLVIVSSSIKLTLMSREESISIMSLIGATKKTIRMIFFYEGIIKASISFLLALGVFRLTENYLMEMIPDIMFPDFYHFLYMYAAVFTVGALGSLISINSILRGHNE